MEMNKEIHIIRKIFKFYIPGLIYDLEELDGILVVRYTDFTGISYVNFLNVRKILNSYNINPFYWYDKQI
jgi:hypothetical protein